MVNAKKTGTAMRCYIQGGVNHRRRMNRKTSTEQRRMSAENQ